MQQWRAGGWPVNSAFNSCSGSSGDLFSDSNAKASADVFNIVIFLQMYSTPRSPQICDIYITQMSELGGVPLIKR